MVKKTKDNKEVPSRIWYYLLDWNDIDNKKTLWEKFSLMKLHDCTKEQVMTLFDIATSSDLLILKTETNEPAL